MNGDEESKNKIYNVDLLLGELKTLPGTYNSILGKHCNDGTCNTILRRKLNGLQKLGLICKTVIPGTRFGKVIFYHPNKEYDIVIQSGRIANDIFCVYRYVVLNELYIKLEKFAILRNKQWIKRNNKVIAKGSVLKWV